MYILCISDIHGKTGKVAELFNCDELFRDLDLIIVCGDLTQLGGYNQAKTIMIPAFSSGYPLYAIPGNMDKPGVIGNIGGVLGDNNINIAAMQFGRKEKGGSAVSLINIDSPVGDDVLHALGALPNVNSVKMVTI